MINPAELNRRVEIQYKSISRNSHGGEDITWTTEATVWAKIRPVMSFQKEFFTNMQKQSEITHIITMRFRRNLTPVKRLAYCNRIFDIESVINVNDAYEELQINASEVL